MSDTGLAAWLETALGQAPQRLDRFETALTHSSHAGESYQRLEFLGDRVLGLVMAEWLFTLFPDEPEGKLSRRLNALVAGDTCAEIAREIGVAAHLRLGKQARDDGATHSVYVLGDVIEALIGALFLEAGFEGARAAIRRLWGDRVQHQDKAPKHPKAELQELAAARQWRPPVYTLGHRSGPHHAPTFTVRVEIAGRAGAEGRGSSKQEAETAAARALLEQVK
ncbi:ribonuclease III [Sphingomonas morindae]|uniref:Ribonuclease 3 n=1 Tax=Sphingomonas morindae TaxID=1541170 RepID=A0ABY4X9N4_9SPHN|nr:ribonuclease III [Sphingomonas morindae]USI73666.1 ribonuclease III [Sphingomonas morindae]